MADTFLMMAMFITFVNIVCMLFVVLLCSTIVYSWYRQLTIQADKMPELISQRINEIAGAFVEPLIEKEELGKRTQAQPVEPEGIYDLEADPWHE